jgi:hypothetical protein
MSTRKLMALAADARHISVLYYRKTSPCEHRTAETAIHECTMDALLLKRYERTTRRLNESTSFRQLMDKKSE